MLERRILTVIGCRGDVTLNLFDVVERQVDSNTLAIRRSKFRKISQEISVFPDQISLSEVEPNGEFRAVWNLLPFHRTFPTAPDSATSRCKSQPIPADNRE